MRTEICRNLGLPVAAMGLILMCASQASAGSVTIMARTSGTDNNSNSAFYLLEVSGGLGSISSVSFDLTADSNAFFDFDGSALL